MLRAVTGDQGCTELGLLADDRLAVSLQLQLTGRGRAQLLPLADERLERALQRFDGFGPELHGFHSQ